MEYYFRRLVWILGRIAFFWMAWLAVIVVTMVSALDGHNTELTPESWRGRGVVVLLFISCGYGTVMLLRSLSREIDQDQGF